MDKLIEMLIRHEGLKLKPYKCTAGKWTIFVGRNYQDNPFSTDELTLILNKGCTEEVAKLILRNDIGRIRVELNKRLKFFTNLDEVRKSALIDMAFQMGVGGLLKFKNTLKAIENADWESAVSNAQNSNWGMTFKTRSSEIIKMLETGEWQF